MTEADYKAHNADDARRVEAEREEQTPEEARDTDRSTVWYTLGTGDMRILRMTLMDQDRATLENWYEQAGRLRTEINRIYRWLDAGDAEAAQAIDRIEDPGPPPPPPREYEDSRKPDAVAMPREADDKQLDD